MVGALTKLSNVSRPSSGMPSPLPTAAAASASAAVLRAAGLDTPVPFSPNLEEQFLPKARFREQLERLLDY